MNRCRNIARQTGQDRVFVVVVRRYFSLFHNTSSNYGITATLVDPADLDGFRAAIVE